MWFRFPFWIVHAIFPPNFSTMILLMESPSPVPCTWLLAMMKRSNILSIIVIGNTASGIGYMKTISFSFNLYPKLIEPLAVNFVALPIRLEKT